MAQKSSKRKTKNQKRTLLIIGLILVVAIGFFFFFRNSPDLALKTSSSEVAEGENVHSVLFEVNFYDAECSGSEVMPGFGFACYDRTWPLDNIQAAKPEKYVLIQENENPVLLDENPFELEEGAPRNSRVSFPTRCTDISNVYTEKAADSVRDYCSKGVWPWSTPTSVTSTTTPTPGNQCQNELYCDGDKACFKNSACDVFCNPCPGGCSDGVCLTPVPLSSPTPQVLGSRNPPCESYGDVNGDRVVSESDISLIRRYLAGLENLDLQQINKADVNASGSVTTADVVSINKYLANEIDTFTTCDLDPTPGSLWNRISNFF